MNVVLRGLCVAVAAAAAGCATVQDPFPANLQSPSEQVRRCAEWFQSLDAEVDAAGVRDAQYARVPGFPYLRVDRISASLRGRAAANEPALQRFADRLLDLDLESRRHEIANLPRRGFDALPEAAEFGRAGALHYTRACGRLLRDLDLAKPEARAALLRSASVPDDYSTASRLLGLYALTRIAFADGVRRWQEEDLEAFRAEARLPAGAVLVRYAPPTAGALARSAVAAILRSAHLDPLGMPELPDTDFERLAAAYAPSFEIAVAGDADRFGALRWRRGDPVPEVNAAEPAVYVQAAYTDYGDRVLLQLVYTIWFPERPAQGAFDLYAGRLDGVMWRVTLARDGEPVLYDSIHSCGCYHKFFPTPRARPRPAPDPLEEWAFVPQPLPRVAEDERPVLRIASGTHFIERVTLVRGSDSVARYSFLPYDALRSMPRLEGGARSAFGPDGLMAGTERAERILFWPMGIASAGAMRQWGRHATAFVGRRHFDDADLVERRFELDLGEERR